MRGVVGLVVLVMACSKPLAPTAAPGPSPATTSSSSQPAGPPPIAGDQSRRYQRQRDPRGGYVDEPTTTPVQRAGPSPIDRGLVQPPPDPEPPPKGPAKISCKRHEFEVERCLSGGMPRRGSDGRLRGTRSCSTRCEAKAPRGGPSRSCHEVSPRRFKCESAAP